MPIGMSRRGLRASGAATETASKPIKAKKIMPDAARMPLTPKCPHSPVLGGMKGVQIGPFDKGQAEQDHQQR